MNLLEYLPSDLLTEQSVNLGLLIVKFTVLVTAVLLCHRFCRRYSAAFKHFVLGFGVVGGGTYGLFVVVVVVVVVGLGGRGIALHAMLVIPELPPCASLARLTLRSLCLPSGVTSSMTKDSRQP